MKQKGKNKAVLPEGRICEHSSHILLNCMDMRSRFGYTTLPKICASPFGLKLKIRTCWLRLTTKSQPEDYETSHTHQNVGRFQEGEQDV